MRILALDIGTKRIGVAFADTAVRIAIPRGMIPVDGNEMATIAKQYRLEKADLIVSGLPRNNQGEETAQTKIVQDFIAKLKAYFAQRDKSEPIVMLPEVPLLKLSFKNTMPKTIKKRTASKLTQKPSTFPSSSRGIRNREFRSIRGGDRWIEAISLIRKNIAG